MSEPPLPDDLATAVRLGGEMGRRFAEFDWAAHPLGSPREWAPELRSAVAVVLTSRFPMAMFLSAPDLFQIYNDAFVPILGDRHPSALGQRGHDAWWDVWDSVGPMLTSVVETGTAVWSDDLMLLVDGGGRPLERFFTFSYSPMIASGGDVYGIFCAVTETTERVLSERRLSLLNSVASAVIEAQTIDDAVRAAITACTDAADVPFIAVYLEGEAPGGPVLRGATSSISALLPPTLAKLTAWDGTARPRPPARVIDELARLLPGIADAFGEHCPDEALVLSFGDGPTGGALVIGATPLRPLDARYCAFCQLLTDQLAAALASALSYEQQRQRADALAELDRAKTAFLTNVSHEFRTPLALLLGPLDDALADAAADSLLADRLGTAERNARRLLSLVDSLLDFSRIEAGRADPRVVCTDVGALTSHIASSFADLCMRAGLDLVLDCERAVAEIDPGMWETVVLNLLSNAVKYTMRGSISVEARSEPTHCRITVRDTGIGITEQDLGRLFDRFYRADNVGGRSVEGTGIGLALVRGLVELHDGTVQIDSELDRGTTVTILLPPSVSGIPSDQPADPVLDETNPYVAAASQWVAGSLPVRSPSLTEEPRPLVLIVDDNADMRAHLDRVLSAHWETILVSDGESALAATRDLHPDLIVTDVMMPVLDGFEFVAAIRADPALAATPVLMLSARAGTEAASAGFAGGADDYLPKPFRSQELVERATSLMAAVTRERTRQRVASGLVELDAALQDADSVAGILAAVLNSASGSGDCAAVAIGVVDGEEVRFSYAGAFPTELRDRFHVAQLDSPLVGVDVIHAGEPMIVTDTFDLPPRYQHAVQYSAGSVRACVANPLYGAAGRVIGVLLLLWPRPRMFTKSEIEIFGRTAELTQLALERLRIMAREHRIAMDFQEQLLDLDRGSMAGVVAAVYQPAAEAMRVGGDWYSVTPLPSVGHIGISVGDVVGHGLPAAIVMSRLRAAAAASALTLADPAAVLRALDTYAATIAGAGCATVAYAVVGDGAICYSCAGHPYPLVVYPDGEAVFLESGRRPPVATRGYDAADPPAEADLPPGSLVLLYTDGLVERPGETLAEGFARLKVAAAECATLPVDAVCAELLRRLSPPGGYRDDVVVLALRPSHSGPRSFATVVPALGTEVPTARQRLNDWLRAIAVNPARADEILLAAGEVVTNAIEHGSNSDGRKTVSVEGFLYRDTVAVTVSDSGSWAGDSSASLRSQRRGRGLTMISGFADRVDTIRTSVGTRVTLHFERAVATANG